VVQDFLTTKAQSHQVIPIIYEDAQKIKKTNRQERQERQEWRVAP
jgi:hypothetical protein